MASTAGSASRQSTPMSMSTWWPSAVVTSRRANWSTRSSSAGVVAGLAEAKHNGVDNGRKARQVDVLGWAVDEAVLADGTGPGEYKAGSVEGPESHPGYLPLRLFGVAHAVAASSGNRLSQRFRTRLDKISLGHNPRRSERLRIVTWSATMPSEMVAW